MQRREWLFDDIGIRRLAHEVFLVAAKDLVCGFRPERASARHFFLGETSDSQSTARAKALRFVPTLPPQLMRDGARP